MLPRRVLPVARVTAPGAMVSFTTAMTHPTSDPRPFEPAFRAEMGRLARLDRLTELAGAQRGLFTREQALVCGFSSSALSRHLNSRRWRLILPHTYQFAAVPPSWDQHVMAVHLWTGRSGVAVGQTAAELHGLEGVRSPLIEVACTGHRRSRVGIIVRRQCLDDHDIVEIGSIPVTTAIRTLLTLAADASSWEMDMALDSALRTGKTTLDALYERLDELGGRGRRGVARLRIKLAERGGEVSAPESLLERLAKRLVARHFPVPAIQHHVWHEGVPIARLDLAFPELKIGIEVDGYNGHSGLVAFRRDRDRSGLLASLGWLVLPFTWDDIRTRRGLVVERIARAIELRRAHAS